MNTLFLDAHFSSYLCVYLLPAASPGRHTRKNREHIMKCKLFVFTHGLLRQSLSSHSTKQRHYDTLCTAKSRKEALDSEPLTLVIKSIMTWLNQFSHTVQCTSTVFSLCSKCFVSAPVSLKENFGRFQHAALSLKLPLTSQYRKREHFWSTSYRAPWTES